MTFDFSNLFWIVLAVLALQPLLTARLFAARRAAAIRAIEARHGSRVITMIHRQEQRSLLGMRVSRHIDLEVLNRSLQRSRRPRRTCRSI
jgi:hypothetical protein